MPRDDMDELGEEGGIPVNGAANAAADNKTAPLERMVQMAVTGGIEAGTEQFYRDHPRFGNKESVRKYLDQNALDRYAGKMASVFQQYLKKGKKPEELINLGYRGLASLVVSGKLFTPEGKEILLSESWQKKAGGWRRWFGGGVSKEILEGEKYLDETLKAFRELYDLMKKGDYAQKFPELTQAVSDIYKFGFLDAAANVLYKNGQLKEGRYITLKRAIREKTRMSAEGAHKILNDYYSQALAASILAIIGMGVLISTATLTGNVVGVTKTQIIPALTFGALSVILGIYLWVTRK